MEKLTAMRVFASVVAEGSFAAAGRHLGLTRSAVSKGVVELEQLLGVRLLDRTTRRVSATEAGRAYYERCLEILSQIEDTELQISSLHDQPKGLLRINAPLSFGTRYLGDAVSEFMSRYPDLHVELDLTDRFIDPIEEGVDVAIRIAKLDDSSLIARKIAETTPILVASPDYLKANGMPKTLFDLQAHKCLVYGHSTHLQRWKLREAGKPIAIRINAVMSSNNGDILRSAALGGQGITQLPTFLVGQDVANGDLEALFPHSSPDPLGIYAIYAANRYLATKTRVFIDFLVAHFRHLDL